MIAKQALIDLGIVLIIPICIVGGYFAWGGPTETALMSDQPSADLGANEPGQKTQEVLNTLEGIHLDGSLFTDEAFTSLMTFTVPIPEVPLSRTYPFTPPPVIEDRLRAARLGNISNKSPALSSSGQTSATTNQNSTSLSQKIDNLKKSLSGN